MKIIAIIPARMGSSRFPGKPLARILDKSMIEHVYLRASISDVLEDVFITTPDEEIRREVERFGGKVIMTSPKHERASDRVAEAAKGIDCDIVINLQGDEPLIHPEMISLAVKPLVKSKEVVCSNIVKRIEKESDYIDPNMIKVVADRNMNALYFSREAIPTKRLLGFGNIPTNSPLANFNALFVFGTIPRFFSFLENLILGSLKLLTISSELSVEQSSTTTISKSW